LFDNLRYDSWWDGLRWRGKIENKWQADKRGIISWQFEISFFQRSCTTDMKDDWSDCKISSSLWLISLLLKNEKKRRDGRLWERW